MTEDRGRAVVLNLTRFGDILQTQPVVAGLIGQGLSVSMVCQENFQTAAGLLDGVDEILPLPGAGLLADLDRSWPEAMNRLRRWVHQALIPDTPDLVLNLTPGPSSGLLARLLQGRKCLGFALDEDGFSAPSSHWAAYLQAASVNRAASPMNIVDVFCRMAEIQTPPPFRLRRPDSGAVAQAEDLLVSGCGASFQGYIGFQLGASDDDRRWPVEFFARLGELVLDRLNWCPVLLGTSNESALGSRYRSMSSAPCIDLIGRTKAEELAAVLAVLRFLITNDTGTMHLAAGLGVPLAGIFLSTAQPWDTGPWLEGSLCLEPDLACHPCSFGRICQHNLACRRAVSPETVLSCIESRERAGEKGLSFSGARVWESVRDSKGFMDLKSLSGHDAELRTRWMKIQRHWYRQLLDNAGFQTFPGDWGRVDDLTSFRQELESVSGLLAVFREQMALVAKIGRPAFRDKAMATWNRLQAMLSEGQCFPILGRMWQSEANVLAGDHLVLSSKVREWEAFVQAWANDLR
ncbi:MAG: glycosyltransferase family 9 protein [Deltaproteobacteria bacterium]|nr:glycosyltransferase family 9 protein [Deltaproteobacteria bacterium]